MEVSLLEFHSHFHALLHWTILEKKNDCYTEAERHSRWDDFGASATNVEGVTFSLSMEPFDSSEVD